MRKIAFLLILAFVFCRSYSQIAINLDDTKEFQTIEGFGGFGAAKPWWEPAPHYDAQYLETTIDNLGVSFFRTQIYWDGENTNDNDDPNVANSAAFNFGPTSNNGKQFEFLKALSEKGARLIATVWTPPTWMKLFDDDDRKPTECYNCAQCPVGSPGTEMCGGRLNPAYYEEFAEYLVTYVKTLKQQTGVDIFGISIQNEPFFANPFESNVVMPEEYADMLKVVGLRFDAEGLATKFFGPEHMAEWSWGWQAKYVDEILNDATVKPHLDIYAVHGYVDGVAADYGSAEGWTHLYENISETHGKPLWMTETSDFTLTGFPLAMSMSKSLYLALKFGRISAWVYWSMHDAMVKNNQLTPLGHAFKNYYRYVRPGATVIDATSSDPQVLTVAFKHPQTNDVTVILINTSGENKDVAINVPFDHTPFSLYRTSATEQCKDLGVLEDLNLSLPANSISTVSTIQGTNVTGVQKKSEDSFSVYPVPSSKKFTIDFQASTGNYAISISDPLGKKVRDIQSERRKTVDIDTGNWHPGIYLVRISGQGKNSVVKICVE